MAKYHISKNGKPALCRATVKPCPLGGDEVHYNSIEEAQKAADEKLKNEHSVLASSNSLNEKEIIKQIEKGELKLNEIRTQTKEICLAAVKTDEFAMAKFNEEFQTPEMYEAAFEGAAGYSTFKYIRKEKQTPEMCLAAVNKSTYNLQYVNDDFKTPELEMIAVKKNGFALEYVKKQTPELCLAAVKQNYKAFSLVKEQTPEIVETAVEKDTFNQIEDYIKSEFKTPKVLQMIEKNKKSAKAWSEMQSKIASELA